MKITRYFLLVFITISLFVLTFMETSGGYLFFVNTFPIVLAITGVVFIEELLGPKKKTKQIEPNEKGGLGIFLFNAIIAAIIFDIFQLRGTDNPLKEVVTFTILFLLFVSFYFLFQKIPYASFNTYVKSHITYHHLTLGLLFFFVFGLFYFKMVYIPHSDYDIATRKNLSFYENFTEKYSVLDDTLTSTSAHQLAPQDQSTIKTVYDAYFDAIGGHEITTENVSKYSVGFFDNDTTQRIYQNKYLSDMQSNDIQIDDNQGLIIHPKAFYYGLSGNIYNALEHETYTHIIYDLRGLSGGLLSEALYSSDPIFPLNTFVKIEVNPDLKTFNSSYMASSDFVTDKPVEIWVDTTTQGLGLLIANNAQSLDYTVVGSLDPQDDLIYEATYLEDVDALYVYPVGHMRNIKSHSILE